MSQEERERRLKASTTPQEKIGGELFGEPQTRAILYIRPSTVTLPENCQCRIGIPAQDVVWDQDDQPHCPDCNALLQRKPSGVE